MTALERLAMQLLQLVGHYLPINAAVDGEAIRLQFIIPIDMVDMIRTIHSAMGMMITIDLQPGSNIFQKFA